MPQLVSRRTLAAGAVWSVPTLAVATIAPAYASSCTPRSVTTTWNGNYTRASDTAGTYTVPDPDGSGRQVGMTMSIRSSFGTNTQAGSQRYNKQKPASSNAPADNNLHVISGYYSGGDALALHQSPISDAQKTATATAANSQTVTFAFSRPVRGLTFSAAIIDSSDGDYWDGVEVSGSPTVALSPKLTRSGDLVRMSDGNTIVGKTTDDGTATYTFASTVSSFTLTYYNLSSTGSAGVDGDQIIYLSPFTFTYDPCD